MATVNLKNTTIWTMHCRKMPTLKSRIRRFRIISRVLSFLISIGVLTPITMTLTKFLQTQNIYRSITHPDGSTTYRTAWAHDSKTWPTYAYFGVALISTVLNFATIFSYRFGVGRANTASYIASVFSWVDMLGNLGVWVAAAAVYRNEKDKHGKSDTEWTKASAAHQLRVRVDPGQNDSRRAATHKGDEEFRPALALFLVSKKI
ncbi:hypothetical protein E8E11_000131 [Didymella keratinophila]|nr:hypothetical protein E8E11_000131 [Didymella keratinophila]